MLFRRDGHTLVRCEGCALVFQDPQPTDDELNETYYHAEAFTEALFGPLRDWTIRQAQHKLRLLRKLGIARPGISVLDVGCSSGAWLEIASGFGMEAVGIDIGSTTAAAARGRGLDVRIGSLADHVENLGRDPFDLCTFWDVLEHLRDPLRELQLVRRILQPSGRIAATFPNVDGLFPRTTYWLFALRFRVWEHPDLPHHLYDLGPRTARALFERAGYRVEAIKTYNIPFEHYRGTIFRKLARRPRGALLRLGFEGLHAVLYPLARLLDRGNAMIVVGTPTSSDLSPGTDA